RLRAGRRIAGSDRGVLSGEGGGVGEKGEVYDVPYRSNRNARSGRRNYPLGMQKLLRFRISFCRQELLDTGFLPIALVVIAMFNSNRIASAGRLAACRPADGSFIGRAA